MLNTEQFHIKVAELIQPRGGNMDKKYFAAILSVGILQLLGACSFRKAYGPGFDFFPRPHLEIRGEYLTERIVAAGTDPYKVAWLLLHYYF